jgi:hypothetical protein
MDHPALPTAAELGISEVEYERILRDLRQRNGEDAALPPALSTALSEDAAPRERRDGWQLWAGLALVSVLVALLLRPPDREPEYAFMQTYDGQPVTYTSCRPVQVAIYPAGGPPDAEQLVREAVAKMRTATGLDIVIAGVFGGYAPNWNFEAGPVHPEDPISVSWQDGDAIAELTDHIAGLGGSRMVTGRNGTPRLVAGTIALSRDYYAALAERDDHAEAMAVLLHEFAHVFGLDHVDSPEELMHPSNSQVTTFGAGDRKGLRLLGQGPCM